MRHVNNDTTVQDSNDRAASKPAYRRHRERHVPHDVEIAFPQEASVAAEHHHVLAYIPWDDAHLELVPRAYRDFFTAVLPYLRARTTDVHTAHSVSMLPELLAATSEPVDEHVIYIATILHDSGWGQMSEQEIVDSLSYTGFEHSAAAIGPKERHRLLGRDVSQKILAEYPFSPALTNQQKQLILDIVFYHDHPWKVLRGGKTPLEVYLVCDADRLWSYTRHNFWQDTIRKNVTPETYAANLTAELDSYFFTKQGRAKARALLAERRTEVAALQEFLAAGASSL